MTSYRYNRCVHLQFLLWCSDWRLFQEFSPEAGRAVSPRHNFDGFFRSLVTVFQILTTEGWNFVMYDGMLATTETASLYFVVLVVLGTYILLNLFVAIMVDGFATDPEAMARFKKVIMKTRAVIQKISSEAMHRAIHVEVPENSSVPRSQRVWQWVSGKSSRRVAPENETLPEQSSAASSTLSLPEQGQSEMTNGIHQANHQTALDLVAAFPIQSSIPDPLPSSSRVQQFRKSVTSRIAWPEAARRRSFSTRCKKIVTRLVV